MKRVLLGAAFWGLSTLPVCAAAPVAASPQPVSATACAAGAVCLSRTDVMAAATAIAAIRHYQCPGTGPAQQPVVDCFLKVSVATRSALSHDEAILLPIVRESQIGAPLLGQHPTDAQQRAAVLWSAQTVPVLGIEKVTEADLDLAQNPQITPLYEADLAPLMKAK